MPVWPPRHFFEIGIYRCARKEFYQNYDRDLNQHLDKVKADAKQFDVDVSVEILRQREARFNEEYGAWRYNQTIGWLRLVAYETGIRGELWIVLGKRLHRRMARKQFVLWGGTPIETQCFPNQSSEDIRNAVRTELLIAQSKFRKGKCVFDLECFDAVSPLIDWRGIVQAK